jgi:radical SAM superfamily enzyme YgiQ (UPF0313 family)
MTITLIRPNMGIKQGQDYQDLGSMEPYALAVVAGAVPTGHEIRMFDDRLETIDYDAPTDLVAITVETFTARRAYTIAQQFRQRGVPVVLGGFHASLIPEEAKNYADSVIVGEAEGVFERIVSDLQQNKLQPFYRSGFHQPLGGYQANRSIFQGKDYLPMTLTHFSRGCPYACSYCPDAALYQGKIRYRPVKEVVREIEQFERDTVFFVDNNITTDPRRLRELLAAITPLKIKWISQADIYVAQDRPLLKQMAQSGCIGLVVGFETLSKGSLRQMNKLLNVALHDRYCELVQSFHGEGISLWAAFLFGYDHDTTDTIKATLDFALKHKFFFAAFNQLIPYYGTPIYQFLKHENRLLFDRWWIDPEYRFGQTAFIPKNMTPEELSAGCLQARLTFNSHANILNRGTNYRANLRTLSKMRMFFKYTYLFKKEVQNKQDLVLR